MFRSLVPMLRASVTTATATTRPLLVTAQRLMSVEVPRIEKSINQVTLLGRVGNEPREQGSDEHPVVTFKLATNTTFRSPSGSGYKQRTEWHSISIFNPSVRASALKFLGKGSRVYISGKIVYGSIRDKNSVEHRSTSIVADEIIYVGQTRDNEDQDDVL